MRQQQNFYPFSGGLDQETPAISMPPGRLISSRNYMGAPGGYRRVAGYERYDGQPAPSSYVFYIGRFSDGMTEIEPGQIVTGASSGAQGVVRYVNLESGVWVNGTAEGVIAIENATGDFTLEEDLEVSGSSVAVMAEPFFLGDRQSSPEEMAIWRAGVEDRRTAIQKVPGSGPVRGVIWYDGCLHAWRDNTGGTACIGWKCSPGGWIPHSYGASVGIKETTGAFTLGETVTGGTSGATGVVRQAVSFHENDWDAGTTGALILDSIVGTFDDGETITGGTSTSTGKANGDSAAVSFPPGGRFRFITSNFYGSTGFERAYGVTGVSQAFEFDGESVIFIPTGMEDDTPFLIAEHKMHLWLGFRKGSLQFSGMGEPRKFSAIVGAAEIGMGRELTNLVPNGADTLLVTTASSIAYITGNNSSDFSLVTLSKETGARPNTASWIGDVLYEDERGIRSVTASQRYGNFTIGTYTQLVQKELRRKRIANIDPVEAFAIKNADTYMLAFNDGSVLALYIGRKTPEPMFLKYPFAPTCFWNEEIDGTERVFAGSAEGFVYEIESGTSFDGEVIESFMQFPFAHQGGPRVMKRYHKAMFELDAPINTRVSVIAQFDYGAGLQPFAQEDVFRLLSGSGGSWDIDNWDEFYWDSPLVGRAEAHIQGVGENMSLTVASSSDEVESHTFQGVTLAYSVRGQIR